MKEVTTSAVYAIKILEELQEQGLDPVRARQRSGLAARDLDDPMHQVPMAKYLRLVESLDEADLSDDFGFLVGERTALTDHGLVGFAILHSNDVHHAVLRLLRYVTLTGPVLDVHFDEATRQFRIREKTETARPVLHRFFVQEWLASLQNWALMLDVTALFSRVDIGYPLDAAQRAQYEAHLHCPVSCEASGDVVCEVAPGLLEQQFRLAETDLGAAYEAECQRLISVSDNYGGWSTALMRLLFSYSGRIPSLQEAATALGVSDRSLKRYLFKEDTSFQFVVRQYRITLAKEYLRQSELAMDDIAQLVGYSNAANFYRTFREFEKMTPSEYRQRAG